MENWQRIPIPTLFSISSLVGRAPLHLATCWRSGTQPPCLHSASSFASDSRISACRKDSFTFRDSSSKTTTRYSTCAIHKLLGMARQHGNIRLVPPAQHIPFFVFGPSPYCKELLPDWWAADNITLDLLMNAHLDPPFSYMRRVLSSFRPCQWRSNRSFSKRYVSSDNRKGLFRNGLQKSHGTLVGAVQRDTLATMWCLRVSNIIP